MNILYRSPQVRVPRASCSRRALYFEKYQSANKMIFDDVVMPQMQQEKYFGSLFIIELTEEGRIPLGLHQIHFSDDEITPFGVMEALYFGFYCSDAAKQFKPVLALGSIARLSTGDVFCPRICTVGSLVSIGIQSLCQNSGGNIIVPAKTKVLASLY